MLSNRPHINVIYKDGYQALLCDLMSIILCLIGISSYGEKRFLESSVFSLYKYQASMIFTDVRFACVDI